MINKNLTLKESLRLLNELLQHEIDSDCDGQEVVYIVVDYKKSEDALKALIPDLNEYEAYLKDFLEDDTVDIVGVWGETCYQFKSEIWVDFKKKRFYVRKWYHVVSWNIRQAIRSLKRKVKNVKIRYKNWRYIKKRDKEAKKRIKALAKAYKKEM